MTIQKGISKIIACDVVIVGRKVGKYLVAWGTIPGAGILSWTGRTLGDLVPLPLLMFET